MSIASVITGIGSYLPERIVTNDDIAQTIDTSDAWIRERTGIEKRHIAADGQCTSHMAVAAALKATESIQFKAGESVGIVVATSTPDCTMPSVASMVQAKLGLSHGPALDVQAACAGFVYALSVAHGWLLAGLASHVIVIGAETMSRIIDWQDRSTCILFGDGAGAVVISAMDTERAAGRGIMGFSLGAQGELGPLLGTSGGVSSNREAGFLFMQGQEVFRHGVEKMASATLDVLEKNNIALSSIDLVVPHQANARMIHAIAKRLDIDSSHMMIAVDKHANTSAASIPLALSCAAEMGRLKPGMLVAMPALGAGLTWGCCVAMF